MNILVVIANYGTKNMRFLDAVIKEYRSMPYGIDIVVLSNVPKQFGPGIEVKTGLPTKNPWSLPFGHRKIFAERLQDYDLFIYSEDDILITRNNIESFLETTNVLPEDHICGFLRYELNADGGKWYPDFLGSYHWLPTSVKTAGQRTFAEFSNLHSACYVLTRDQLRKAIRSGGYLVDPHEGRYDMLCSAATDPYTQCGLKKVICISHMSDLLVHHLPDNYVGKFGITESDFNSQINWMLSEEYRGKAKEELFTTTKNIDSIDWDKRYFNDVDHAVLSMVSRRPMNILSIGCGYPSTELALVRNNHAVTAIPLDPVIGVLASSRGITIAEPDFERAFIGLSGASFDCIIFTDVLHHLEEPLGILSKAAKLLSPGGELLISIPNFRRLRFVKSLLPLRSSNGWTYPRHYLHAIKKYQLEGWLRSIGIEEIDSAYVDVSRSLSKFRTSYGILDMFVADRLIMRGKQSVSR